MSQKTSERFMHRTISCADHDDGPQVPGCLDALRSELGSQEHDLLPHSAPDLPGWHLVEHLSWQAVFYILARSRKKNNYAKHVCTVPARACDEWVCPADPDHWLFCSLWQNANDFPLSEDSQYCARSQPKHPSRTK